MPGAQINSMPEQAVRDAAPPLDDAGIRSRLAGFMSKNSGRTVRIAELKRFPVGFSWITYGLRTENEFADGSGRRLILRLGPPFGLFAPYSAMPQFEVLGALQDSAVPVPKVYWGTDSNEPFGAPFFISEFVSGDAPIPMVSAASKPFEENYRASLANDFVAALAALHTLDWRAGPLAAWDTGITPQNAAHREIERWAGLYKQWALVPHPTVHWALGWLRQNCPAAPRISIIHGDYRIGNFLETGGRITAILDWELVHLGDPHEDLGWACLPQFMGGSGLICRLLPEAEFIDEYQKKSGIIVNPDALTFYQILALLKLALINMAGARCFEDGKFHDMRMPAMGIQISSALRQLQRLIERVS